MTHSTTRLFGAAAVAVLLLSGPPTPAQQKPPAGATITVTVSGVHDRDGILRVNLYKSADGFPADTSKAFQKANIVLKSLPPNAPLDPLRVSFTNLSPGTYAVCSIHDSNGNNKLDTNFLGIPREDWAVSNDARPRFRSPHFDEAQFTLAAGQTKAIAFRVRH
jgi:uncharacterized protein (DUF2141 family)